MKPFPLASHDYAVSFTKVRGKDVGYPQCRSMWHMQFTRGGCGASAFLETKSSAIGNARRIINCMRGTHDCLGNAKAVQS